MSGGGKRAATVEKRGAGERLDLWMTGAFPDMSRKMAKKLIDAGAVAVNGRIERMANRLLSVGEKVEFREEPKSPPEKAPRLTRLWSDDWLTAIDKPPGLVSGPTKDPGRPYAEKLAKLAFGNDLTLLHRLDRDTSGVLIFGRSKAANGALLEAFRKREIFKRYLAICAGKTASEFSDVCHLREVEGSRVVVTGAGGARAETAFRTIASARGFSLVEARPKTGRMHQIRVQLARLGHPIAGDSVYGGAAAVAGANGEMAVGRQMLHAWKIAFAHPATGEDVTVTSPPPDDFKSVAEFLFGPEALKGIG